MLIKNRTVFHFQDLRKKILTTLGILMLIRFFSQVPIPMLDLHYFQQWFEKNNQGMLKLFTLFSGGSLERFSPLALGITPFITASIMLQLLSVVFPSIEELRKDGKYGKRKLEWYNRFTAGVLSFFESIAITIGFGKTGILPNLTFLRGFLAVLFLTAGSIFLIACGEWINKKGIGNGISLILTANILSGLPGNIGAVLETYVFSKDSYTKILYGILFFLFFLLLFSFTVLLNLGYRKITVKYAGRVCGRESYAGERSHIPVKVNLAGVAPVIFTSSVLSFPQLLLSVLGKQKQSGIAGFLLAASSQNNWFSKYHPEYTIGFLIYAFLLLFFSFFYVSITFSSFEMAEQIRKQGGCIPGIRQGKPTELYIQEILDAMTLIGTTGLFIILMLPMIFSGISGVDLSISGTSLIIITGVLMETLDEIEAYKKVHACAGFLPDKEQTYKKKEIFTFHKKRNKDKGAV